MSRVVALLTAIAGQLRAAEIDDARVFADVRVALDQFDLEDLLKQSTRTPAARVCFMRGKPVPEATGGRSLDVSVAIVVIAEREGRANPDISSADIKALDLIAAVVAILDADPYVGLVRLAAAQVGEQIVAVAADRSKEGKAIALLEVGWLLHDAQPAREAIRFAAGVDMPEVELTLTAGGETIIPEAAP